MRLAVCLITADRPDLTAATLESLDRMNPHLDAIRLHGDDGSEDMHNHAIAAAHDFSTVYSGQNRAGQIPALKRMWSRALRAGASHILHLENDQEFVRPLPTRPMPAQCIRLYGKYKMLDPNHPRALASEKRMGTGERIEWAPVEDWPGWERGFAHWGGQASITVAPLLYRGLLRACGGDGAATMKDIGVELNRLDTLRPEMNISYHMDAPATPGHWLRG